MLNDLDLNRLKVFSHIYRNQSVREAGRVLGLTPSAISQSLKGLERQTNRRLFQRISKRMVPTLAADSLFEVTQRFMSELEACISNLESDQLYGCLRIGAPHEFGSRQLVETLGEFNQCESVNFSILFDLPDRLMALLVDGKIDMAFCDFGSYLKNYERVAIWRPVFTEEAVLVCSKLFYSRYVKGNHSFSNLSRLPHVDYRQDGGVLSLWYRHHFDRSPKNLPIRLSAGNVNAVITAAARGLGLAFIPAHLIKGRSEFVYISIKKTEYKNPIMLVQLKDRVPSKLEKKFLSHWANQPER